MAKKSDSSFIVMGIAGVVCCLIILAVVSVLVYLFAKKEEKKKEEEEEEPAPTPRLAVEPSPPAEGCPSVPYTYCSTDTIDKVYIVSGCGPSSQLITKLTNEGKISGENDPKVINCSENQDVCTAAGIRSYPSIICENTPSDIYQGYCA